MKHRVGYKISEIALDALNYLKGQSPDKTETSIVEDAIISAAIAAGWRKKRRQRREAKEGTPDNNTEPNNKRAG